jgi:hypothetical protein
LTSSGPGDTTTAALTINGSDSSAGSYQVVVTGTSGSLTSSLPVPFNVGDYTVAPPSLPAADAGTQVSANLIFTSVFSYSGQISAACDSATGAKCTFAPQTLIPQSPLTIASGASVPETVTISIPSGAIPGVYNLTINTQDLSGAPSHSLTTALTVQDFTLGSVTPSTQSIGSGQPARYHLSVAPVGASFANAVTLSCSGAPVHSTCSFTPNPITPGNAPTTVTMTITTRASTPQGNYSIVVTGVSGPVSHMATASLTVANTLQLAATQPFPQAADAGSQQSAKMSLTPNYSGTVTATCNIPLCTLIKQSPSVSGNPISFSINGSPVPITAQIDILNSAVPGPYSIDITVKDATGGGPTTSLKLPYTVAQDYVIANLSAASQTITAGQSITYNLSVAPVGAAYGKAVTLSCSAPLFTGSCTFSPNPTSPLSNSTPEAVVMTVTTPSATAQLWAPGGKARPWPYAAGLALAVAIVWSKAGGRRRSPALLVGLASALLFFLSCGGGSNGGSTTLPGTTPQGIPITYTITVVGSPTSISQPFGSTVTLIVNP